MNKLMKRIGSKFCTAALVVVSLVAMTAHAEKYYWNNANGGYWDDAANWTSDSGTGTYPTTYDNVGAPKVSAPFTITLRKDESAWVAQGVEFSGTGNQTFELGGHMLNNRYLQYANCGTPAGYNSFPARNMEFKNGTLYIPQAIYLGTPFNQWNCCGSIVFSDCVVTSQFELVGYRSAIVVRDGSKFVFGRTSGVNQYQMKLPYDGNGSSFLGLDKAYFTVTGENSRVEMTGGYNLSLQHVRTGFFLFEGTSALIDNLYIGAGATADGTFADVRGATLEVNGDISIGADNGTSHGSELRVGGAAAKVTASSLTAYDGEGCALAMTIPDAGFDKVADEAVAPIKFDALSIVPRGEGLTDYGAFKLKISCYSWMTTCPETTIPLVELSTADAEALAALRDSVEWADVPPVLVESGKAPVLSLSADNTKLLMTSPKINYNPAFTVSTQAGGAAGEKKFVVGLTDYGAGSSSITSITLEYADNPDYTGSTSVELLNGTPVTTPVPCELNYTVNGGFAEHATYYGRMTLKNEQNYEETVETVFYGDGVAQTISWAMAKRGTVGSWQDAANWTIGSVAAGQYPHAEDTANLGWSDKNTTITLQDDVSIQRFDGTSLYPGVTGSGSWTLDLNGHTFEFLHKTDVSITIGGGSAATAMDLSLVSPVVTFRNGTVQMPTVNHNFGFLIGNLSSSGSGTLILDNVTANAKIQWFGNGSRIFVCNGARFNSSLAEIKFVNHTAYQAYPLLCVTGANSRVEAPAKEIIVRGKQAALYALDGGAVSCGTFWIGQKSNVEKGDISSDSTLAKVDDGTITATGDFNIGWPDNVKLSPKLYIGGTNGTVTAGAALNVYEKLGAEIEFALPLDGYNATPLKAKSLAFVARTAGYTDYGATKLTLTGVKAWAKKNQKQTIELIKLTTPNAEGLAALKANATADWARFDLSSLAVSADGTALTLTAPARKGLVITIR